MKALHFFFLSFIFVCHAKNTKGLSTGNQILGGETINIIQCVPKLKEAEVRHAINMLPNAGIAAEDLYKNAKLLTEDIELLGKLLDSFDNQELLDPKNIAVKFSEKEQTDIALLFNHPEYGIGNPRVRLKIVAEQIRAYAALMHAMFNKHERVTLIELMESVDIVSESLMELSMLLRMLMYLEVPYQKAANFNAIIDGMHQHLFTLSIRFSAITAVTFPLRAAYLGNITEGQCSPEQMAEALGVYEMRKQNIKLDH